MLTESNTQCFDEAVNKDGNLFKMASSYTATSIIKASQTNSPPKLSELKLNTYSRYQAPGTRNKRPSEDLPSL
jgi:hypothetical protein